MASDTGRLLFFVGGAVGLAAAAMFGVVQVLTSLDQQADEAARPKDLVTVVVADRQIYAGEVITAEDLTTWTISARYLPKLKDEETGEVVDFQFFNNIEEVIGQVPKERVLRNELLRPERLSVASTGQGLNAIIQPGMRGISVDLRGGDAISGFLEPGNFVDILVTMPDERRIQRTETIMQSVLVIGVNSRAQNESAEEAEIRGKQRPSVTFMVTPEQAEEIAFAAELGVLSLSLRNRMDKSRGSLGGADLDNVLARFKPPPRTATVRQVLPQPEVATVQVVRGTEIVNERVQDGTSTTGVPQRTGASSDRSRGGRRR